MTNNSTRDLCRVAETIKYFLMGVDMDYQLPQVSSIMTCNDL